ncbi:hypothetical protein ES708_01421 [subsurface metagenome]
MTRTLLLWGLIAILIVTFAIWLWQGFTYPHTIYEYIQTDELVTKYEGRVGGFAVDAVPIWEPNNPAWVDLIRRWAPITLFALVILVLYAKFEYRNKAEKILYQKRKEQRLQYADNWLYYRRQWMKETDPQKRAELEQLMIEAGQKAKH